MPSSSSERDLRVTPAPTHNDPWCHPGLQEESARPRCHHRPKESPYSEEEECHRDLHIDRYHPHLRHRRYRRLDLRKER